jgi:hypothetical protein
MLRNSFMSLVGDDQVRGQVLIFFHIAKTAGTTLHTILSRNFSPDTIMSMDYGNNPQCVNEFKHLAAKQKTKLRYLHAHMVPFGIHEHIPRVSAYIVLLRDPVERVLSEYFYIRRMEAHPLHHLVISKNIGLDDFISSGISPAAVQSGQTRLLSGVKGVDWATGCGPLTQDIFENTKRNLLSHFMLVGLTERFDEFLVLLKRAMGWKNIKLVYRKQNSTPDRPRKQDVSKDLLKLMEEYNHFDNELYEFARQRFDELICSQERTFFIELQTFRLLNKMYNQSFVKAAWRPFRQVIWRLKS